VGTSISDILTGMYGAIAILAALRERDRTGRGSVLDLAMLDCTVSALENAIARYSVTGEVPRPLGTRHPSITPFQAYAAADGPIVIGAGNDALFRALCDVLDAPQLRDDPRFATNALRTQHADALEELLSAHLARETVAEWMGRLSAAGVPAAPIRSVDAVMADPSLRARGVLHEMHDGQGGTFTAAGSPIRIDGRALPLSSEAPELDADRVNVFRDWGVNL
jgi:CoA:oxalate CoA-transferase